MPTTYKHKNYSVTVGDDGAIIVQRDDWLSKYSAAIHAGDTTKVNEFGKKNIWNDVEPLKDTDLNEGDTIFHIPTYERALAGNPKMRANRLVSEFAKRVGQPIAFKIISRWVVAEGLRDRVINPSIINQGRAPVCPSAALIFTLAQEKPDVYVKFVIDLFEKGVADIGKWKITPCNDLKMYQIPLGAIHPADWIPMASIRDSENWFFDYQQVGPGGGARFGELEDWVRKSGYTKIVRDKERTRTSIKLASDYWGLGYKVILNIDANILEVNWQALGETGHSNHDVVLTSRVNFLRVGAVESLSMTVFTWGQGNRRIPAVGALFVEDFLKYYFGFIAAKF